MVTVTIHILAIVGFLLGATFLGFGVGVVIATIQIGKIVDEATCQLEKIAEEMEDEINKRKNQLSR